jgi:hypothetical protein
MLLPLADKFAISTEFANLRRPMSHRLISRNYHLEILSRIQFISIINYGRFSLCKKHRT